MDLTAYKNQPIRLNRSRSSSCCAPFRKRFFYQEFFPQGTNTLVRSYSSDEVWCKGENNVFQTIQVSSFITSQKKGYVSPEEKKPNDLPRLPPRHSVNEADTTRKKNKAKEKPTKLVYSLKLIFLFFLATTFTACAMYFYREYNECNKVWDIHKTKSELSKNIFGQHIVLTQINSVLKNCTKARKIHVMVFTGSVGVGKTFASSIIRRNFPWRVNKQISFTDTEKLSEDVRELFQHTPPSACGCNLIIIDDLTVLAIKASINFIEALATIRKNNENFLVILIFKTHCVENKDEIVSTFEKFNVDFVHASFFNLKENIVRKCYNIEIKRQGIIIPEEELTKMIRQRMNYTSHEKITAGCKGVAVEVAAYLNKTAH